MNILALDLGTKMGWASSTDGVTTSGTENFNPGRFEGGGMRYLRFRNRIQEMIALIQPEAVYFEEVRRHLSTDAAHAYGGFMAHLVAVCEELKVPYKGIPVGTIKKHATGKGKLVLRDRDKWVEGVNPEAIGEELFDLKRAYEKTYPFDLKIYL